MKGTESSALFAAMLTIAASVASPVYAQDSEHGQSLFKACAACHATDNINRVGPGLARVVGRKAGTVPGFRYSRAMKNSGIIWDKKTLSAYLESPQEVVPGNRMPFAGMENAQDRADLVAYLATLK